MVPTINPPIIEIATTDRAAEPSARFSARGSIPRIVVEAVIRMGLSLVFPAAIMASLFSMPLFLNWFISVSYTHLTLPTN